MGQCAGPRLWILHGPVGGGSHSSCPGPGGQRVLLWLLLWLLLLLRQLGTESATVGQGTGQEGGPGLWLTGPKLWWGAQA